MCLTISLHLWKFTVWLWDFSYSHIHSLGIWHKGVRDSIPWFLPTWSSTLAVAPGVILDDPFFVHPQYPSSLSYIFPLLNKSFAHESLGSSLFSLPNPQLSFCFPSYIDKYTHSQICSENVELGGRLKSYCPHEYMLPFARWTEVFSHAPGTDAVPSDWYVPISIPARISPPSPMAPQSSWLLTIQQAIYMLSVCTHMR